MAANVILRMTYTDGSVNSDKIRLMTAKDTRLTLRVRSDLKAALERLATEESRSVAQICEAFLHAGLAAYKKEGPKYIHRFLGRAMAKK